MPPDAVRVYVNPTMSSIRYYILGSGIGLSAITETHGSPRDQAINISKESKDSSRTSHRKVQVIAMATSTRSRQALSLLRAPQPRWQGYSLIEEPSPLQRQLQHGLSPRTKRSFTSSRTCPGQSRAGQTMPKTRVPAQKSIQVAMNEQKAAMKLPDDIGLLPGQHHSFIHPSIPTTTTTTTS